MGERLSEPGLSDPLLSHRLFAVRFPSGLW